MTFELVIVGFGNTLRRDDGVGPVVVELLMAHGPFNGVATLARPTLTPDLAEILADSRAVIFVDASAELEPGFVECRRISGDPTEDVSLVHSLSPGALLTWTGVLYGRAPAAELWLIGVESTELSETLTDTVRARVPQVVAALRERIALAQRAR
ncbi:MAG: hydrogenase maturation protease [Polyangiaceae bacterium]